MSKTSNEFESEANDWTERKARGEDFTRAQIAALRRRVSRIRSAEAALVALRLETEEFIARTLKI